MLALINGNVPRAVCALIDAPNWLAAESVSARSSACPSLDVPRMQARCQSAIACKGPQQAVLNTGRRPTARSIAKH